MLQVFFDNWQKLIVEWSFKINSSFFFAFLVQIQYPKSVLSHIYVFSNKQKEKQHRMSIPPLRIQFVVYFLC